MKLIWKVFTVCHWLDRGPHQGKGEKSMEYICERKRKGVTWVVCKLFHIDCPEFWSRNSHFAWNQLLTNIRHIFDQNLNISSPGIFPGHLSVCRCSSPTQPSNQIWRWWYLLKELNKNQTVYKHRRPMKFEMRAIHFKEENVDLLPYNYIWQFHYLMIKETLSVHSSFAELIFE